MGNLGTGKRAGVDSTTRRKLGNAPMSGASERYDIWREELGGRVEV